MIRMIRLCLVLFIMLLNLSVSAQSLDDAIKLIEQERYLDAAKLLRPMADNGNAEAQYWAACLFFDGKGVQKNDNQGLKYSIMSADQGFRPSILLLVNYYEERNAQKYVNTLKKYIALFPHLLDDIFGCKLGYAIVTGYGTEKNDEKGWNIIEKSKYGQDYIIEKGIKGDYYNYKAKHAEASCLEDYADFLFGNGNHEEFEHLVDYMYESGYLNAQTLHKKADNGNAWAMAYYAIKEIEDGHKENAKKWAKKSSDAGSSFGKYVMAQIKKDEESRISYYIFGNRKELIGMQLLDKNGVYSGANFNREYATKIDNDKVFEIRLYSSSARILSTHPAGTYQLEKDRYGQYVLKISQPKMFWKNCDLLVIQTN